MSGPIVIIGPHDDRQVRAVTDAAQRAGVACEVAHFRSDAVREWRWTADAIATPDALALTDASGIYVRSVPIALPRHRHERVAPDEEAAWSAEAARRQRIHGFFKSVQLAVEERSVPMLNPVWGYQYHRSKPGAELALAAAGVPVPRGVATSDVAEVRALIERVGPVAYKPVAGGGRCRILDPGLLDGPESDRLLAAPCYFQEVVPGRNLRIYTLEDRLLAAFDIASDDIDFRGRETSVDVVDVAPEVLATATRAAKTLGLPFAGSDIKLCPDGRHVVLDVNPSPMFAGLDPRVDHAIADGMVAHLAGPDR